MREVFVDTCLYLKVSLRKDGTTGKKWLLRYIDANGRQQCYTFGEYPEIGLADARNMARELRKKSKEDPTLAGQAKTVKSGSTFAEFCQEWINHKKEGWGKGHTLRQRERLGTVIRVFGEKDINAITMDDIIAVIGQKPQAGNYEAAKRMLSLIRNVLEHADTLGRLSDNRILVRIDSFRKTMATPKQERHLYKELSETEIGKLLADIGVYSTVCKIEAGTDLRVAPYLLVRLKELCGARWAEIDLEKAEWGLPVERMKMDREHIVPLPKLAVELLSELKKATGNNEYVFPSYSKVKPHIGKEALIKSFRRIGYVSNRQKEGMFFTIHGFRGIASTILYQKLKFPAHRIGLQLAHVDENKVRPAYNRVHSRSWLDERREILQAYADYLEGLKMKELENRDG